MDLLAKPLLRTLADVLEAIEAKPGLKPSRRRDLQSALSRLASMADIPLEEFPLDMEKLRQAFGTIEPAAHGIGKKTLTNIRSDVMAAIVLSGLRSTKRPHARTALAPPWLGLWRMMDDRQIRFGLSRFLRFCSAQGIAPADVSDTTVVHFLDDLTRNTLARRIPAVRRSVPVLWNRACNSVPSWPQQRLTVPDQRRGPKLTPLSVLAPGFAQSLDDYTRWLACEDPFDPDARSKALRPTSIATIRQALRLAVHSAITAGHPNTGFDDIGALTRPAVFTDILRQLNKEANNCPSMRAHQAADAILDVARYLKQPPDAIETLKQIRKRLPPKPRGLTAKNKTLLRTFEDPALYERITAIPKALWEKAISGKLPAKKAMVVAQNAILFELLMHAPLRLRNIHELTFDIHITWPQGPGKPALLHLEASDTKNDRPYEAELVEPLASMLSVYRQRIVPAAIERLDEAVFVSVQGRRKSKATIAWHFLRVSREALGIRMSPHQIRHVMAKFLLDRHPGAHELVREWLGHRSLRTTREYYAPVDTRRAVRFNDQLIEDLRKVAVRPKRSGRK
jgi:integrase